MKITVQSVTNIDEKVETVEQLLQAGSCGPMSGGCETPITNEKGKK
ncbi:hypothetical protein [Heyndrickxia coagulans]|uniref:Uncharacterized protein n=1 Tax=Heyndrickxia coagulans TaxID=1398 RepID=A0A133KL71_HEYCO|nr:hypothetical protein [Heyndrickxia coagulans]KWZ80240.1 hypothetical protein HMPREF3213_02350 [Heyndrickxia coagulans]QPG54449.1 hypothetical protein IR208_04940 [Heyndrickxia coagulans]WNE62523.1 hypothetical protein KIY57_05300 [Heyndrickxia coagulans]